MFEVGRLIARIALEGSETFARQLQGVKSEWKQLADTQKQTAQQSAQQVGGVMVGAGAALVASTALVIKSAMDWESAWAGVLKTVEGSPEQLAAVEGGLRGLTSVLPASHEEIAAVAEAAGQLGVQTDNVVDFTKTMIDLGETTNLSSEEAATSLARFMNVMGTAQTDVDRLGAALVGLGNNYATTESEILAMATRLSGAGRQINLTEGQTLGLAAALSSVGIEAEAGGSAISKVMIDIASSVDQGGERVAMFAQVAGVSADEFSRKWRKDPGDALAMFVKGLANAEAQGTSMFAVLEELDITEIRMRDALLRSAAAADMFAGAMGRGSAEFEANNALVDEAAKRYETVESKIAIAGNAINDAAIDIGSVFLPAVAAMAEGVAAMAAGFAGLDPQIQGFIGVMGLGVGAVLLFGGTMLLTIPKIVEFRAALAVLNASMPRTVGALRGAAAFLTGPWGLAFAAAAVGVTVLENVLQNLQATSSEIENSLRTASSAAEVFAVVGKGKEASWFRDVKNDLADLPAVLQASADQSANLFMRFNSTHFGAFDALREIGAELGKLSSADLPAAQNAFRMLLAETDGTEQSAWRLIQTMGTDYVDALTAVATEQGLTADKTNLIKIAMGESGEQAEMTAEAYVSVADSYIAAAEEAEALTQALNALVVQVMEANGVAQDAVSTNARYREALSDIGVEVQRQRDAYEEAHDTLEGFTLSLDQTTVAGSANAAMLSDVAAQAQKAAEAQYMQDLQTMSATEATDKYVAALREGRDALIATAEQNGFTRDSVVELADSVYALPSEKEIKILAETATAQDRLNNFIWANDGRKITIGVGVSGAPTYSTPGGPLFEANGGRVEYYANGGRREHHVAQIARAGTTRVWNEPETEGETYIPHAMSKRSRSEAILAETADDFGFDLVRRGGGGVGSATRSSGSGQRIEGELTLRDDGDGLRAMITGIVVSALDEESDAVTRGGSDR